MAMMAPVVAFTTPPSYAPRLARLILRRSRTPLTLPTVLVSSTPGTADALCPYFRPRPRQHYTWFFFQMRTWERAKLGTTLDQVVVAMDDERIAECCREFGADVIMTSESCQNGAEHCSEALEKLGKRMSL